MSTLNRTALPDHTPEVHAALEEVRDLLVGIDTSTQEGTSYALTLLRARALPDTLIYIAQHQPITLSSNAEAWAMRVLQEDESLP